MNAVVKRIVMSPPTGLVTKGLIAHYKFDDWRNLLKWSEDFSNAVWTKSASGTGVTPVITLNAGVAPDGTSTATRVQFNAGVSGHSFVTQTASGLSNPHTATNKIYLKSNTGATFTVALGDGLVPPHSVIEVGSTWVEAILTTTPSTTTHKFEIFTLTSSAPTTGQTADILVWHPHLQLATVTPDTYQKTTDGQTLWNNVKTNMAVTNIVANGNFESTDDWSTFAASLSVSNNVMSVTGDGSNADVGLTQITTTATVVGDKVDIKAFVRVTNTVCSSITVQIDGSTAGTNSTIQTISSPVQNTWYEIGAVGTEGADFTGFKKFLFFHRYANAGTANGKVMEVKLVKEIVLTTMFGAGNEPTAQQCEDIFSSWFDGTITMDIPKYNGVLGSTSAADANDPTPDGKGLAYTINDYNTIGGDDTFKGLTQGGIEMVHKPTSLAADYTLFSASPKTTASQGLFMALSITTLGAVQIFQRNADSTTTHLDAITANGVIVVGGVYHIVYDVGPGGNSLSINGKPVALTYTTGTAATNIFFDDITTTQIYYFGAVKVNGTILNFPPGCVNYEGLIYNRHRIAAEVSQNYHYLKSILKKERGLDLAS